MDLGYSSIDERNPEKVARSGNLTEPTGAGKIFADGMWILRTVNEGEPEQTFRILPGGIRTVGRAVGADFILDAPLVSRVHCRLTALPSGELEVRDLDSTNGTFVNGSRVDSARVTSGDRIGIGRVELVALRDAD